MNRNMLRGLVLLALSLGACAAPAFPLRASSRWIVDAKGTRVKFACANWSGGAEKDFVSGGLNLQSRDVIAQTIAGFGFNCVRLLWSLQMYEENIVIRSDRLTQNPDLIGKTAREVFDAVVTALTNHGLMVILDNHMSRGDWCCSESDGNGLWYADNYPESSWLADWQSMAARYVDNPFVVGAELRNELRCATVGGKYICPTWGTGDAASDWKAAAGRGAAAVLAGNKNLLIVVDGLSYSTDFTGVYNSPLKLPAPFNNQLVYAPHDYSFSQSQSYDSSYLALSTLLGKQWGFILEQDKPYTAPLWISEFGTPHDGSQMGAGTWFQFWTQYLTNADIDWGYWRVDGTESNGTSRTFGAPAGYGVMNVTWNGPALEGQLLRALQPLMPAHQGPLAV